MVRTIGDVLQPATGFRASAIEKFSVTSILVVDEGVVAFFGSYQWCLFACTTYLLPEVLTLAVCSSSNLKAIADHVRATFCGHHTPVISQQEPS